MAKRPTTTTTATSILDKLGISKNRDMIEALQKMQVGDKALYRKIVEGQQVSHEDTASLKKEMEEVNKNLKLLQEVLKSSVNMNSNGKKGKNQLVDWQGKLADIKKDLETKDAKQAGSFSEIVGAIQKHKNDKNLPDDQYQFLIKNLLKIGEENKVDSKTFSEFKEIFKDRGESILKDDDQMKVILSKIEKETSSNTSEVSLKVIEDQLAQANLINAKTKEKEEAKAKKDEIDRIKERDKKIQNGAGALGSLLGLPSLTDLKSFGEILEKTKNILKDVPGIATLGTLAKGLGAAGLGVAIGMAIGKVIIDPLFKYLRDKEHQRAEKTLAGIDKVNKNLGSGSPEAEKQARANSLLLESAASQGVFGESNKKLGGKKELISIDSFNEALKNGATPEDALTTVQKRLNQFDLSSAGTDISKIKEMKKSQAKDFESYPSRVESFKKSQGINSISEFKVPDQEDATPSIGALPTAASVYRDTVTEGINNTKGGTENGLQRTTDVTAQSITSKAGFRFEKEAQTGNLLVDSLKSIERFEPVAKDDGFGNLTIGYGHALQNQVDLDKYKGVTLSEKDAEDLLQKDIKIHQSGALKGLKVPVSSEQMTAMTMYAFNKGANADGLKRIVDLTNNGKTKEAADVFLTGITATNKKTGKVETPGGLVKRRGLESGLFLAGAQGLASPSSQAVSSSTTVPNPTITPQLSKENPSSQAVSSSTTVPNPTITPQLSKENPSTQAVSSSPTIPNPTIAPQSNIVSPSTQVLSFSPTIPNPTIAPQSNIVSPSTQVLSFSPTIPNPTIIPQLSKATPISMEEVPPTKSIKASIEASTAQSIPRSNPINFSGLKGSSGNQSVSTPPPAKTTGINDLSLALIKNGMLDGV